MPDPNCRGGRAYLVRLRTSVKNRIHGLLTSDNCRSEVADLYGKAGRLWLEMVPLFEVDRIRVGGPAPRDGEVV